MNNKRTSAVAIFAFMFLTTFAASSAVGQQMPPIPGGEASPNAAKPQLPAEEQPQVKPQVRAENQPQARVARIGLAMPKTQMTPASGGDVPASLRQLFASYLKSPRAEVVIIEARAPSATEVEAEEKGCDFVLFTSITQKKGGDAGWDNVFAKVAPQSARVVPVIGGTGRTAAIARQETSNGILTAGNLASSVKDKDEVTLEYYLIQPGDPALKKTDQLKAKAHRNGEDLLTPLVEKMAEAVLARATNGGQE